MIYLGGIGLALFLDLLLLSKAKKTIADKILTTWLFIITIHLLLYYIKNAGLFPQLLAVDFPLPLLHGPFLFLYTQALTTNTLSFKKSLLHFVPALAVVTLPYSLFLSLNGREALHL